MFGNLIYPILAIVAETCGKVTDKLNFRRTRITTWQMLLLIFIFMSAFLTAYIFLIGESWPRISLVAFALLALIAMVSFASNVFDVISLKSNDISLREPMSDFQTILAGLIAYLLFPDQRKTIFLVIFIAGIFITYWGTHRRKLRKYQIQGMHFLLLGIIFEAFLPAIYQITLGYVNPTWIAFFRITGVLLLSLFFFPIRKTLKHLTLPKLGYSLAGGFFYSVGAVVSLIAINTLGVVQTMLIIMLKPALDYLASYFILREKVRTGEVISSLALITLVFNRVHSLVNKPQKSHFARTS